MLGFTLCIPSFPPDFLLNVPFVCFEPLFWGIFPSFVLFTLPSSLSASARKLYLGSGGGPCPCKQAYLLLIVWFIEKPIKNYLLSCQIKVSVSYNLFFFFMSPEQRYELFFLRHSQNDTVEDVHNVL